MNKEQINKAMSETMNIEEQFYKEFEVEQCFNISVKNMVDYYAKMPVNICKTYPPITAEKILAMFNILASGTKRKYPKTTQLAFEIGRDFKEDVLSGCIQLKDEIKEDIQKLFKE